MPNFSLDKSYYFLTKIIVFFIFYQQVLTVNIGGSFKLYELLLIIMTLLYFFDRKVLDYTSIILLYFFILTPLTGIILYFYESAFYDYYWRFPEAKKWLRFNPVLAPFLIFGYNIINWVGFNCISKSKLVYANKKKIIRIFIFSGSLVCCYALYARFGIYEFGLPDIVPKFLDSRNSNPQTQPRFSGFSSEPGTFVYLIGWMIIYLVFYKNLFQKHVQIALLLLSLYCFIMTMSTAVLGLIFSLGLFFTLCMPRKRIFALLMALTAMSIVTASFRDQLNYRQLKYAFIDKVERFIVGAPHTNGSGAMRYYTSSLGFELFKRYPLLGVGAGNSYFYLWRYEHSTATVPTREHINHSTPPQNSHAKVLSERGIIGYSFLLLFFLVSISKLITSKRDKKIDLESFSIGMVSIGMFAVTLFSIYPIYSFFLWANVALLNNSIFLSKGTSE